MTKQNSPDRENDASLERNHERNQPETLPPAVPQKEDDRETGVPDEDSSVGWEYDHRGVLMPRRTRIGGIIMPQ